MVGFVGRLLTALHLKKAEGGAPAQPGSPEGNPRTPPTQPLAPEGMSWKNTSMEGKPPNPQAIEAGTGNIIPNPEAQAAPATPEGQTPSAENKG